MNFTVLDALLRDPNPELERLIASSVHDHDRAHELHCAQRARVYADTQENLEEIEYDRNRTNFWYITINPQNGITYPTLKLAVATLILKMHWQHLLYSFEITENTERAPHCHLLVYTRFHTRNTKRIIQGFFHNSGVTGTKKATYVKWPKNAQEALKVANYIKKTNPDGS